MRRHLLGTDDFKKKRQTALEAVELSFASYESRAIVYLETMIGPAIKAKIPDRKKKLSSNDKVELQEFQRQCLGAIGVLVSGGLKEIISSKYLLPDEKWTFFEKLCAQWRDEIVPMIRQHPIFRGEIYEPKSDDAKSLMAMIQATTYGLVNMFALMHRQYVMQYIDINPVERMPEGDKLIISECLALYLKIVSSSERLIKCSEELRFPYADREKIWATLYEIEPDNERLIWFEKNGEVTLYPAWWEASATLSDRWGRYIELEFKGDTELFYASEHSQLMSDLSRIERMPLLSSSFDVFDYLKIMKYFSHNLAKIIVKSEQDTNYSFAWALRLRQLTQKVIMQFHDVFNDECEFYRDSENRSTVDKIFSDLSKAVSMIDREGRVTWPSEYFTAQASIADVWQQCTGVLGYKDYQSLMTSRACLVTHHLTWTSFEARWERQYTGDVLDPTVQASIKKDLDACKNAILTRLECLDDLSEQERADYRRILETYAAKYKDEQLITLLESTTRQLNTSMLPTIWKKALCLHIDKSKFYRQPAIVRFITPENYAFNNHEMKALMAEGAVELIKLQEGGFIKYDPHLLRRLHEVTELFLCTRFSRLNMAGVFIASLKDEIHKKNETYYSDDALPRKDMWLAQASQRLSRLHGGSMIEFSSKPWVESKLTLKGYSELSLSGKRLLVRVIYHRLQMYYDDVDAQYSSVRFQMADKQVWLQIAFSYIRECRFITDEDNQLCDKLQILILKFDQQGNYRPISTRVPRRSVVINPEDSYENRVLIWKCSEEYVRIYMQNYQSFKEVPEKPLRLHLGRIYLYSQDPVLYLLRYDSSSALHSAPMNIEDIYQAFTDTLRLDRALVNGWMVSAMQEGAMLRGLMVDDMSALFLDDEMFDVFVEMTRYISAQHLELSSFYLAYLIFLLIDPAFDEMTAVKVLALSVCRQYLFQRDDTLDVLAVASQYPGFEAYFGALNVEHVEDRVNQLLKQCYAEINDKNTHFSDYQEAMLDVIDFKSLGLEAGAGLLFDECRDLTKMASYAESLLTLLGMSKRAIIDAEWERLKSGDSCDWSKARLFVRRPHTPSSSTSCCMQLDSLQAGSSDMTSRSLTATGSGK